MVTATLTSKGQITIPKPVRDSLRLHTGDKVAFVVRDESMAELKPVTKTVDEMFGRLCATDQPCRSIDEMNAAVAKRIRGLKK